MMEYVRLEWPKVRRLNLEFVIHIPENWKHTEIHCNIINLRAPAEIIHMVRCKEMREKWANP